MSKKTEDKLETIILFIAITTAIVTAYELWLWS